MDNFVIESEFLRPLCNGWLQKLECAAKSRKQWKDIADECMMFYSNSASAMWDPQYSRKFWKNVKLPKFRVTINKAFELVAVFGPNLLWEVPHRTVKPKRPLAIPESMFDHQMAQMAEQLQMMQQQEEQKDQAVSYLLDRWLNYTPSEQPGGGLVGHSERAVIDALITGRGVLATRPYQMPGSGRTLTGSFRIDPCDIFIDPDFNTVDEARWIAIRHTDVHTDVEERFELPKDSLKNKATLESSWSFSELSTDDQSSAHRKTGKTNDLVVWYEIYSKCGVGCRNTTMDPTIREHLNDTAGKYAYIAICGDVPYPLNAPSSKFRGGATDAAIKEAFSWPVPFWADDCWPVEFLDFYHDPKSAWPIAPLAPGLGELKLLNFLVSWLANRTWSSSRDFWCVAQPYIEEYREHILNGDDQAILPTPVGVEDVKKAVQILQQPETRQDMKELIAFVSDMFDRRTGLTPMIYGLNQDGTQNRTAEETIAKSRAVQARPEYMQKQVVGWQSRAAKLEAFVARWFVTGEDVGALLGPVGTILWQQHVQSMDVENVVRQFQYSVAAASIRRPNRDRDIANIQQLMNQYLPLAGQVGASTGDYAAANGIMRKWSEFHDADMEDAMLPEKSEEEQQQQAQAAEQAQQIEMAKAQAEIEKTQAEAEATRAEAMLKMQSSEGEQAKIQMELAKDQIKAEAEREKAAADLEQKGLELTFDMRQSRMEMLQDAQRHEQEMLQDQEKHEQDMRQKRQAATLANSMKRATMAQTANSNGSGK